LTPTASASSAFLFTSSDVRIITIRRREFDNISPLFQPGELKTTLVRISGRQQNTPGRMPMSLEIQPLEIKQWLKDSMREGNIENPTVEMIRSVVNSLQSIQYKSLRFSHTF
jgi:hypothetical protein